MNRIIKSLKWGPVMIIMGLLMSVLAACGNTTDIPKSAAIASELSLQAAAVSAPAAEVATAPTMPLPAISVAEVTGAEILYPPPVLAETAAQVNNNPYPVASYQGTSVLPAPVVVSKDEAPPTPTNIATVAVPTVTQQPTESVGPTATAGPTFTPPALPSTSADEHYWFRRPVAEGGIVWTDKIYPYGSTRGGTLRPHHGVEFNVPYNTPILAVAAGTVVFAGSDSQKVIGEHADFYGNAVVIEHEPRFQGEPLYTLYGHLNEVYVAVGQFIQAEEVIGLSGATGVADGPHMHFEVRVGANTYDSTRNPLLWLYPFPDRGTLAGRVIFPDGRVAYEAPLSIRRIDGSEGTTASTTTYADSTLIPDEGWEENFVFDDVYAGYYEVMVRDGKEKYTAEVWIYPRQTSFVEIVIGE